MKLALIQHDIVWENPSANFVHLRPMVESACGDGAELIVLTEMFSWGFSMAVENIAEPEGGQSAEFLTSCASELGVWMCGTYPEKIKGTQKAYNQLLLAGPSGEVYKYAKIHPFSYSGEDKHYEAGDKTLTVDINGIKTSAFTCYDLRFGNEFWKLAETTDLYIIPANWPKSRQHHWTSLLTARAIENQAFVAGVNRVGKDTGDDADNGDDNDTGILYGGGSIILGPSGEVLAEGGAGEEILMAEISSEAVAGVRQKFPFLKDRKS